MMTRLVSAALSLLAVANAFDVPSLRAENYDKATAGKTVFLKFFAPWCGHCKRMASDWEKLAEEWNGNEIGLVAEVDCTDKGKKLCDVLAIRSFPTVKYGDPSDLEDYNGGRSFEDLSAFASENLVALCSPKNLDLCDDDKKKRIEEYLNMEKGELAELVMNESKKLKEAEDKFQEQVNALQEKYSELETERDEAIAAVLDGDIGLMRSVKSVGQFEKPYEAKSEL